LTIIEANQKKTLFLDQLIVLLDLKNVKIINSRAEDSIGTLRETFDIVCARAVIKLTSLLEITIPLVTVNGYFIAYQGKNIEPN
jgi:16S rRNA (guanine527-N7)-methyltransferase